MQQRDSRSAITGTAALKLDTRVSSAHIIQFPGSGHRFRQVNDSAGYHHVNESKHIGKRIAQSSKSHLPYQTGPRATPAQTAGAITLFTLLTILAGIL